MLMHAIVTCTKVDMTSVRSTQLIHKSGGLVDQDRRVFFPMLKWDLCFLLELLE